MVLNNILVGCPCLYNRALRTRLRWLKRLFTLDALAIAPKYQRKTVLCLHLRNPMNISSLFRPDRRHIEKCALQGVMGMHSNGLPNVCVQGPRLPRELLQGPSAPVPTLLPKYKISTLYSGPVIPSGVITWVHHSRGWLSTPTLPLFHCFDTPRRRQTRTAK